MSTAGYSGTSLARKLGIKPGMRVCVLNPPADYRELLEPVPEGLQWSREPDLQCDLIHLFCTERSLMQRRLVELRAQLRSDAALWVSWPKRASKQPTDISENSIRDDALPLGWVDIKVCAVDATWSGLKLVVRKQLR